MPGAVRQPSVRVLEKKAARIAAVLKAQPTADQLHALKDDLELLDSSLRVEACSGQHRSAVMASKILADLVHAVMAGLELLAKAASATSEAARSLTDPLELLGRPLLFLISTAASSGKRPKAVPSDFLSSWGAAAAPAVAYLQQHGQVLPPTGATRGVLTLVVALLRLWRVAALHHMAAPAAAGAAGSTPSAVVTTMPIAADLCVLLLTSSGAAAAFPQEVQVSTAQGQASVKYLLFVAATALHVMASLLASEGTKVMGPQHTILPPALVADSVQRAVVLHLAACMPYCMEQMGKQHGNRSASSSSGGQKASNKGSSKGSSGNKGGVAAAAPSTSAVAAAEAVAREQLHELAFQRMQDVHQSGRAAREDAGVAFGGADGDTPRAHLCAVFGGVQLAFVLRRQAMGHPAWPALYMGAITRPPPAAAGEAVDPLLAPVMAPGVDPLLLHELLLHLMLVLGVSDVEGLSGGLGISQNSLQPATPRSADKARVARCLQLLWLGLGRELLQAAGVTGDELDADAVKEEGRTVLQTDGSTLETAASASDMLKQYGYLLIQAFVWHSAFLPPPQDIFAQQPQLACRVLEAAARACTWPAPFAPPQADASDTARHFKGLYLAAAACTPASTELAAMSYRRPKLVQRCCSLMVSALKQVQQQLAVAAGGRALLLLMPGWHVQVLPLLLAVACLVAGLGTDVSGAVTTEAPGQGTADPEGASSSMGLGGVSTAWLALSGRGIAAGGCLLASPVAVLWLQDCTRAGDSSVRMAALKQLASLYKTVKWVTEQLAVQQQPSCAGPAADAASLRKLQKQGAALFKQWQPLQDACAAALDGANSSQAQVAALSAFGAACGAGGWLPVGLQELGEGVWSAFPHKYACGDPGCLNLQALTETSAAKKSCTDCKPEGVRYCCKEHQVRHWPQHKKACRAINKQALAANSDR